MLYDTKRQVKMRYNVYHRSLLSIIVFDQVKMAEKQEYL